MGQAYTCLSKSWAMLFEYEPPILCNPLPYLAPIASLTTFLIISAQCVWTWYFIAEELGDGLEYDTSGVFAILTATLGFILPLQMNAALGKNKACLDNYNAFLGDIQAFAWDVIAFHTRPAKNDDENRKKSEAVLSNIFDILVAMPALAKWHFRGGADFDQLTTKSNIFMDNNQTLFKRTQGGSDVINLSKQIPSMAKPEACFFKLLDYSKDLAVSKTQQEQSASLRSWERAYGSWGNMGNLDAYKPPGLFTYVLNVALFMYSVLLPFQFVDQGYHAVWMVAIVGYFFLGLNSAGSKVGNAFAEGPQGFQTVSDSQRGATKVMAEIWDARFDIFKDPELDRRHTLTRSAAKSNLAGMMGRGMMGRGLFY